MSSRTARFQVRFEVDGDGKIKTAFDQVAAGSNTAKKAVEGVGGEVLQLSNRLDTAGARTRQYARDVAVLDAAQKTGLISARQHKEMLGQLKGELDGTDWGRFREGAVAATAAVGGLALTGLAIAIRNSIDAQRELGQLEAIIKSTGAAAGYNAQQLLGMADGLSAVSTFSAGEIVDAQTRLLSYSGVLGENIPRAMQAIIDQSARLGISVTQSAETIGRALESPSKAAAALAQQGFGAAFTTEVRATIDALVAAGREAEAQQIILGILEESYAGAAQAARDTFGGALLALKNTLNDLMTGGDGDLEGARQAVEDLIGTLNDPATRAAFAGMVEGIASISGELVQGIALIGQYVGEWNKMRALGSGQLSRADADLDSLNKRLGVVGKLIRDIEAGRSTGGQPLPGSTITPSGRRDVINRLEAERTGLMLEIRRRNIADRDRTPAAQFSAVSGGVNRGRAAPAALVNPDLQKQIDQVNDQARAYGLSRTALAELNREKALASATNDTERTAINQAYDALVKRIGADEAATKGAQATRKAREEQRREEERLQQLYERTVGTYREQLALANDGTEAARVRYSIENGALSALEPQRQREILQLAEQRDAQQRLDDVRREGLALTEAMYTPQERMRASIDEYTAALARGSIDLDTWNRLVADARAQLEDAERAARRFNPSMQDIFDSFNEGGQLRLGDDLYDIFDDNADRVEERWKQLLLQMAADLIASRLFETFGQANAGTGSGGFWAGFGRAIAGAFGSGRASGGGVRAGGVYEFNEQGKPEVLRQGNRSWLIPGADGYVLPASLAAAPGMRGGAAGPIAFDIQIEDKSGQFRVESAETEMRPDGRVFARMIVGTVQQAFAAGDMDHTMQSLYGQRRVGQRLG